MISFIFSYLHHQNISVVPNSVLHYLTLFQLLYPITAHHNPLLYVSDCLDSSSSQTTSVKINLFLSLAKPHLNPSQSNSTWSTLLNSLQFIHRIPLQHNSTYISSWSSRAKVNPSKRSQTQSTLATPAHFKSFQSESAHFHPQLLTSDSLAHTIFPWAALFNIYLPQLIWVHPSTSTPTPISRWFTPTLTSQLQKPHQPFSANLNPFQVTPAHFSPL